jgi:dihydroxyacid dehydratase/phosphogluconate dehydratase
LSGVTITEPSRETPVYGEFDIVVVGGGPAGIMAATSAARAGCSTLLIERYGFLGGAGTAGGLSTFCGLHARTYGADVRVIRGLADELLDRLVKLDGLNAPHLTIADGIAAQAFDISAYKIAADELVTGSGARILFHAMAVGVVMAPSGAIDTVLIESKSGRQAVRGRFFIDASGDGDLACWAGVPWEKAPPVNGMMYPSLMFRINGVDVDRAGPAPWRTVERLMEEAEAAGTHTFPRKKPIVRPQRNPLEWRANLTQLRNPDGGAIDGTNADELTRGELIGRQQALDAFTFIRDRTPGFEDSYIVDIAPQIGIRETRRIIGPYQLSESDVLGCADFPDTIGVNGWPVEAHVAGTVEFRWQWQERGFNQLPFRIMAAGRLNIPAIIVACGYQLSGVYHDEPVDFEDIFRFAGHVNAGRMTVTELGEMSRCAVTGPGVCAGTGTANSMHLAAEALGMALPGTTPALALGPKMWDAVAAAGARIVELVAEDRKPRSILTSAAFANAVTAILAVSGSVNCLKHLQAIAVEAGCDVDVYRLFESLAPRVPLLTDVKPNGNTQITEFDAAGGSRGLLAQLAPLLDLAALTVAGGTLGEALASAAVDSSVIRPLSAPLAAHPAIVVMRGSLAPDGAVLKRTVADDAPLAFRGPAKVVHSRDEGVAAARAGRFAAGDVVVLTGLGLRGSPGMGLTSALMFAIDGAGLSTSVAVITDGQMSGLVNGGLVVAEVSPEGATGGPLGLVRDGDMISIDVNARTLDLEVSLAGLDARRASLPPLRAPAGCGWLSVYARTVAPLGAGAVLSRRDDRAGLPGE